MTLSIYPQNIRILPFNDINRNKNNDSKKFAEMFNNNHEDENKPNMDKKEVKSNTEAWNMVYVSTQLNALKSINRYKNYMAKVSYGNLKVL